MLLRRPGAAVATLRDRLTENRIVSITVGRRANKTAHVPFLGSKLRLATAPVHLARTTGAALLPVFAVRTEPGHFAVMIEGPLIPPAGGDPDEPYEAVAQRCAEKLGEYILAYPDQWSRSWASED